MAEAGLGSGSTLDANQAKKPSRKKPVLVWCVIIVSPGNPPSFVETDSVSGPFFIVANRLCGGRQINYPPGRRITKSVVGCLWQTLTMLCWAMVGVYACSLRHPTLPNPGKVVILPIKDVQGLVRHWATHLDISGECGYFQDRDRRPKKERIQFCFHSVPRNWTDSRRAFDSRQASWPRLYDWFNQNWPTRRYNCSWPLWKNHPRTWW